MQKGFIQIPLLIVVIFGLAVAGGGVYVVTHREQKPLQIAQSAATTTDQGNQDVFSTDALDALSLKTARLPSQTATTTIGSDIKISEEAPKEVQKLFSLLSVEESKRPLAFAGGPSFFSFEDKKSQNMGRTDYDVYVSIAFQYEHLGNTAEAAKYLKKAIEENPERSFAYLKVGELMTKLSNFPVANESYKTAIKLDPSIINHAIYSDFLENDLYGRFIRKYPLPSKSDLASLIADMKTEEKSIDAALAVHKEKSDLLLAKAGALGLATIMEKLVNPTSPEIEKQYDKALAVYAELRKTLLDHGYEDKSAEIDMVDRFVSNLSIAIGKKTIEQRYEEIDAHNRQAIFDIVSKGTALEGQTFTGTKENMFLKKDGQEDTVKFTGSRSQYSLHKGRHDPEQGFYTVVLVVDNQTGVINILSSVEYLQFSDQRVSWPDLKVVN